MAGTLTPELADKERQAVELRVAGYDYPTIAAKLGYANHSGAYKAVQRALKRSVAESADELRKIEDRRLDALLAGVWQTATTGVYDSIDRALRISKRRSELLGLDAPVKVAPTTPDGKHTAPITIMEVVQLDRSGQSSTPDGDR